MAGIDAGDGTELELGSAGARGRKGMAKTETAPGLDKGNVASGRDRRASTRRARIAAGRRVESPAVSRGMGVTVEKQ
jgi:hypothetical protein